MSGITPAFQVRQSSHYNPHSFLWSETAVSFLPSSSNVTRSCSCWNLSPNDRSIWRIIPRFICRCPSLLEVCWYLINRGSQELKLTAEWELIRTYSYLLASWITEGVVNVRTYFIKAAYLDRLQCCSAVEAVLSQHMRGKSWSDNQPLGTHGNLMGLQIFRLFCLWQPFLKSQQVPEISKIKWRNEGSIKRLNEHQTDQNLCSGLKIAL